MEAEASGVVAYNIPASKPNNKYVSGEYGLVDLSQKQVSTCSFDLFTYHPTQNRLFKETLIASQAFICFERLEKEKCGKTTHLNPPSLTKGRIICFTRI